MILTFRPFPDHAAWPALPTNDFLNALRAGHAAVLNSFPDSAESIDAANERILKALEQPVSMPFPIDSPLEDVLKYIKQATTTPTFPGIPIYIDPLGLQEAERSLTSTVTIDLQGVPLRETLHLCLKQLGLDYSVTNGHVLITNEDSVLPVHDPFLVVGHCLLALIAAGLGGVAAPLVSDWRGQPHGQTAAG
jgi:hypothetical protein